MADKSEKLVEKPTEAEKVDKAIDTLLDQVRSNLKPAEALQQTQALLNMAHTKQILSGRTSPKKPGTDA